MASPETPEKTPERKEKLSGAQEKQIRGALKILSDIWNQNNSMESPRVVVIETEGYRFELIDIDRVAQGIMISKKKAKKGDINKMRLDFDKDNCEIYIEKSEKSDHLEIVGTVRSENDRLTVDNVSVVLPILKKFSGILNAANKKKQARGSKKVTSF